jgi:glycine oxidase
MKEYMIVGGGLAGIAFAETALNNGASIVMVDSGAPASSQVAAGLYNPVVLKRLTAVWKAAAVSEGVHDFYPAIERRLDVRLDHRFPVLRRFHSVEEQNNWFAASDKPALAPFLHPSVRTLSFDGISAPFGYGEVLDTGYVDTALLLKEYRNWLAAQGLLRKESFDYGRVEITDGYVRYQDMEARHLVCCDGFAISQNPFFRYLPLDGTKGELLVIRAEGLKLERHIVKAGVFLLPLGSGYFKVGATYNPVDKTYGPTASAREELLEKLSEIVTCSFEITDHMAGIRPTVKDRRALIGTHPAYGNVHILNGLGSRGVLLAPYLARQLYGSITDATGIDPEVSIARYEKKYYRTGFPS